MIKRMKNIFIGFGIFTALLLYCWLHSAQGQRDFVSSSHRS